MADTMSDREILARIRELVTEEDRLHGDGGGLDADALAREQQIEVALDRCWDLLRQRRARREAGDDPDEAAVRSADVVESYEQ